MINLRRLALSAGLMASLILGASARADVIWVGWDSTDWADANNWAQGFPTNAGAGNVIINPSSYNPCVVSNAGNYTVDGVYVSIGAGFTVLPGGQLTIPTTFVTGIWGNCLPVEITGGALNIAGYLNIGAGGYNGNVAISGGTVTAGALSITAAGGSVLDLSGTGKFVTVIGQLGNINYWIKYGHNITAYGGTGTVNVDTNTNPGHIILTGISAPVITTRYWTGSASRSWSNPNNFQSQGANLPGVPETGNTVWLPSWAASEPLINNGGHASLNTLYVNKNATIAVGGSLSATYLKVGQDTNATLTVSGGTLSASNHLDVGGYGGVANMIISGGSVAVGGLYFNLNGDSGNLSASCMSLSGGTLTANSISINETHGCNLNLCGGTLVLPSSQLSAVQIWMNDGSITAYGMATTINDFDIDSTTTPGSLRITAKILGFAAPTFPQWDPQVFTNLPSSLDQAMNLVPPGARIVASDNGAFGCAVAPNGEVYFTEYIGSSVKKYNPVSGDVTTLVSSRPGAFGIAVDSSGNIFYAQEGESNASLVTKRTTGGSETTIMSGLDRVRQLATDTMGNLYVVLEAGSILKWTASSGTTTILLGQGTMPLTPEGIAVRPDGRIYFQTYSHGGHGTGMGMTEGAVWVRETNGVIHPFASGFSRGRGLALHPSGDLYAASEANVWDNGNSGVLFKIATNGVVTPVLTGIDYPQFPAIGSDGKVYFGLGRDLQLACYDPRHSFTPQVISSPAGLALTAEGATWGPGAGLNYPIGVKITNPDNAGDSLTVTNYITFEPGATDMRMWLNVPVTNLSISLVQVPDTAGNPNSGLFKVPNVSVTWPYGSGAGIAVPLRIHQRCRWPMTNGGDACCSAPAPDFAETPVSYLVYVSVVGPPALKIQLWTGNQVRISWPTTATGYALQRSATVSAGYASPSLTVTVEGSENVVYDTRSSGARFYRLIK